MNFKEALKGAWVLPAALIADRLTKVWASETLASPYSAINGVLGFRYAENTGAAFSMLSNSTLAVSALTSILILGIIAYLLFGRDIPRLSRLGLWLVVSGGAGNLYDRLVYGYVVDFIELLFINFAIFNIADICVTCGAALAVIACLRSGQSRKG